MQFSGLRPPRSQTREELQNSLQKISQDLEKAESDDYERNCLERWLMRLLGISEENEWPEVTNAASAILLQLTGRSNDSADSIDRSFPFRYRGSSNDADTFCIAIKDESFVIGSQTWNSAPLISQRIAAEPHAFFKLPPIVPPPVSRSTSPSTSPHFFRVLELGSGTGLAGLAAAAVLSRLIDESQVDHHVELILTDFHPDVLQNLTRNVEANRPAFQHPRLQVRVEKLDWREPENSNVKGTFDVILGSDLVYEEVHAFWVAEVVDKFLGRPPKYPCFTPPLTPDPSRPSSPSPLAMQTAFKPMFHLLLPLRPTFLKESQATHRAFNSTYQPHASNADTVGSDRSGSNTPAIPKETKLAVKACQVLQGPASGQGCRNYEWLTIQRA